MSLIYMAVGKFLELSTEYRKKFVPFATPYCTAANMTLIWPAELVDNKAEQGVLDDILAAVQ